MNPSHESFWNNMATSRRVENTTVSDHNKVLDIEDHTFESARRDLTGRIYPVDRLLLVGQFGREIAPRVYIFWAHLSC